MNDGTKHRAGYAALVGSPNAGKSTLLNGLMQMHLAITSRRPQTTRNRVSAILNGEDFQAVLVDTPGILAASDPLQKVMMSTVRNVVRDCDLAVQIVDAVRDGKNPQGQWTERFGERPAILLLNKIDRIPRARLLPMIAAWSEVHPWVDIVPISALKSDGLDRVARAIGANLPEGPPLFPEDMISEEPERFFVAEFIREQVMRRLGAELPYATAVGIERFDAPEAGKKYRIEARIYVERESQKAIVVGARGAMIKAIGTAARRAIEQFLGAEVYLELRVKVDERWTDDPSKVARHGYRDRGEAGT